MSDQSSSTEDESPETKLRVSFILSPSIRSASQRELLELPAEPIAVPASIRKRGLSAVVNHLLDRKVPKEEDDDEEDGSDNSDDDDEDKLPSMPFDFLLNDKLLRLPLESAARREGLSTERALELQYFPARLPPKREGESESLPDWITAMDYIGGGDGGGVSSMLFAGGGDGVVRAFSPKSGTGNGLLREVASVSAHTGPVKCLASAPLDDRGTTTLVATGSVDQTLVTHAYRNNGDGTTSFDLHAVYSGGHANSVGSVALCGRGGGDDDGGGKILMASGDWDGGLAIWEVPPSSSSSRNAEGGIDDDDDEAAKENAPKKKRKGSKGAAGAKSNSGAMKEGLVNVREVRPLQSARAHTSSISGLAWGHRGSDGGGNGSGSGSVGRTLITGSWDHGLKVYDVERMDCVLALNGSRVVTSLGRCSNSDVVATGGPDYTVRLWDMRTNGDGSGNGGAVGGSGMDKSLRQSHKAWVSSVRWSPTDPFVLASTSHDGTLKVWDIRSSLPLHTVRAVDKKGEKALCLAFGDGVIYSGGSDCVVKQFACKI